MAGSRLWRSRRGIAGRGCHAARRAGRQRVGPRRFCEIRKVTPDGGHRQPQAARLLLRGDTEQTAARMLYDPAVKTITRIFEITAVLIVLTLVGALAGVAAQDAPKQ